MIAQYLISDFLMMNLMNFLLGWIDIDPDVKYKIAPQLHKE